MAARNGGAEKARSFQDLLVWRKAHSLVKAIYRLTQRFPVGERFGLAMQMRRAAVSVPANIAEGFKKRGVKDRLNIFNIAQGSLEELRYYLILSRDLGYVVESSELEGQLDELARMLHAFVAAHRP